MQQTWIARVLQRAATWSAAGVLLGLLAACGGGGGGSVSASAGEPVTTEASQLPDCESPPAM